MLTVWVVLTIVIAMFIWMANGDDGKATVNHVTPVPLDIPGVEQRAFVPAKLVKEPETTAPTDAPTLPSMEFGTSDTAIDSELNKNSW